MHFLPAVTTELGAVLCLMVIRAASCTLQESVVVHSFTIVLKTFCIYITPSILQRLGSLSKAMEAWTLLVR